MTRISIIIPTHNRARLLQRAIESAKHAGTDVEIVVVDDASTDETPAICRELTGITYVRLNQNVGLARARNTGILRATGEFVAFLDDDDLRIAGSADKQANVLEQNEDLGFVYGQVHIGDSEHCIPTGEVRPAHCQTGDLFWELLKGNFIYVPSVMVRKRHFEAIGLFDLDVPGTEDWCAWIRLAETHAVGALDEPVAIYRDFSRASAQMSSNRSKMCKSSANTLIKALRSPRAQAAAPEIRRKISSEYMNFLWDNLTSDARYALSENRIRYAIRNYVTAFRLNPRKVRDRWAMRHIVLDLVNATRAKS